VLDKYHWMLYFLVTAMYPRFLITLDENLESKPVTVRVGQVSLLFHSSCALILNRLAGCRCRRSSRQTTHDIRFPDAPDTRAAGYDGARRVGHGGVHLVCTCTRGLCHIAEESWVGEGGYDAGVGVGDCFDTWLEKHSPSLCTDIFFLDFWFACSVTPKEVLPTRQYCDLQNWLHREKLKSSIAPVLSLSVAM
jgi:hypothetical protein